MIRISLAALVALGLGCHHDVPAKTIPTALASTPQAVPIRTVEAPAPVSPNVAVSDDLARRCTLKVANVQTAPKFDFDQTLLLPSDRDVLEQIATCVMTGPLKGKHLELIGRADPRGTEEYNLGLGSRRAAMVSEYLSHLGVGKTQLAQTTRGALDASGSDESGWKLDRRVDVQLE